jgi:hypothetical protein
MPLETDWYPVEFRILPNITNKTTARITEIAGIDLWTAG